MLPMRNAPDAQRSLADWVPNVSICPPRSKLSPFVPTKAGTQCGRLRLLVCCLGPRLRGDERGESSESRLPPGVLEIAQVGRRLVLLGGHQQAVGAEKV